METSIGYTDRNEMEVSSTEQKMIHHIQKLQKDYPESVTIIRQPQENYGMIYAVMPTSWLRIAPPKQKKSYTDEQKEELRRRLAVAREVKEKARKEMAKNE